MCHTSYLSISDVYRGRIKSNGNSSIYVMALFLAVQLLCTFNIVAPLIYHLLPNIRKVSYTISASIFVDGGCSRISHCQWRNRSVTAAVVWLLTLSWSGGVLYRCIATCFTIMYYDIVPLKFWSRNVALVLKTWSQGARTLPMKVNVLHSAVGLRWLQ